MFKGDISNPKKTKYNLSYYTKLADELIRNGAHVLCIKVFYFCLMLCNV